jgi:hypothetical protein
VSDLIRGPWRTKLAAQDVTLSENDGVGVSRLRQVCTLGFCPSAVIVRAASDQGATFRTTGMVIDFPGLANSMTLISPT